LRKIISKARHLSSRKRRVKRYKQLNIGAVRVEELEGLITSQYRRFSVVRIAGSNLNAENLVLDILLNAAKKRSISVETEDGDSRYHVKNSRRPAESESHIISHWKEG
jgi:hypothetical protein